MNTLAQSTDSSRPKGRTWIHDVLWFAIAIEVLLLVAYCGWCGWEAATDSPANPLWEIQIYQIMFALLIGSGWITAKLVILAIMRFEWSNRVPHVAATAGWLIVVADAIIVIVWLVLSISPRDLPLAFVPLAGLSIVPLFIVRNWCRQGLIRERSQQLIEIGWLFSIIICAVATFLIWEKAFTRSIVSGGPEPFMRGYETAIILTVLTVSSAQKWKSGGCITGVTLFRSLVASLAVTVIFVVLIQMGWAFIPWPVLVPIAILLHLGILLLAWRIAGKRSCSQSQR